MKNNTVDIPHLSVGMNLYILILKYVSLFTPYMSQFIQHHLERRPVHRSLATSQTSEVVDRAPKKLQFLSGCNF